MTARAFIGAGDLYIARQVNNVYGPYLGPYECHKFEIKPNVDIKEQVSKGRASYGQVIETVAIPKPAQLTVELAEVNKTSLAIALLGTTAALAQTAGSLASEVFIANLDGWTALTKANLTGTSVITNSAGTTTYVNGTDYIVNLQLGWVKALVGGAITDLQSLKYSGTYGLISGVAIKGQTQTQVRARFKLDGKNFADDLPCVVTVYEAVLAADAAFDFLANDFNSVSLPGRMKTPVGFTEPFLVELRDQ